MKKMYLILLFAFALIVKANAQVNLVPNPSFEAMFGSYCVGGSIDGTPPWVSATGGSPDCFKTCATLQPPWLVPQNMFGYQWPRTGIGYAGLGFFKGDLTYPNSREYIQVQLTDSLIKDRKYNVSFFVNLSDSSWYATDDLGAYFSDTAIHKPLGDLSPFSNFIPQIANLQGNFLADKINWTEISGIYIAHGGEKFITIGNFYNDANTDTIFSDGGSVNNPHPYLYYYIDDVSVTLIPEVIPPSNELIIYNAFTPNADGINDVFHIKGTNIKTLHAKIINRWGQELYKWDDVQGGWDGKYKGLDVGAGAYFYVVTVVYEDGTIEEKKGALELVR